MADLRLTQIREKKFRQHYGSSLDQFTDEELLSRYRFEICGRSPQERPQERPQETDEEKT